MHLFTQLQFKDQEEILAGPWPDHTRIYASIWPRLKLTTVRISTRRFVCNPHHEEGGGGSGAESMMRAGMQ
jgi:hypothetical protein